MKYICYFLFFSLTVVGQTTDSETESQETVGFQIIENVPVFPGCEQLPMNERRQCFNEKIQEHIIKNFNYPRKAVKNKIQGKVFVIFIIEKDGTISVDKVRGPDPILEEEAKRIILLLPQMTPGYFKEDPVRVMMSIPISFSLY